MAELTNEHCVPCRGGIPPLERPTAESLLKTLDGWSLRDDARQIEKRFEFDDFQQSMAFVNRVAELAETEGHHPDICIFYNKVEIKLMTHKIKGLHRNDFILAAKVNQIIA